MDDQDSAIGVELADALQKIAKGLATCGAKVALLDLLADKARDYPYNWFNFYEFWNTETET